jgi:hypothetical protein
MKKLTTPAPDHMNTRALTAKASVSQKPSKVWCAAVLMSQQLVDAPYRPMTATATTPVQDKLHV